MVNNISTQQLNTPSIPNLLLKILLDLFLLILIIILGFVLYYLYLNIPRTPETLDISIQESTQQQPILSQAKQFYPNMKFNHNNLTYSIDPLCEVKKNKKIKKAFEELTNKVPLITFHKSYSKPDIEINCNKALDSKPMNKAYFIAGEGGAKEIIQTKRNYIITKGVVYLYDNNKIKTIECDYPNVELHELMHVFGFNHSKDKNSLMYPLLESCKQKLDLLIIKKLKQLYSKENLPDIYFENIIAIKKGKYLDYNLTIRNSGSIDSGNVTLTILDNDKTIEYKDLGNFKFGSGLTISTTNLKLAHLNPYEIKFIIDKDNIIKELDKDNNVAKVSF